MAGSDSTPDRLGESLAAKARREQIDFIGLKAARELLEEWGVLDDFAGDDAAQEALAGIAQPGVVTGMLLAKDGITDALELEAAATRLFDEIPKDLPEPLLEYTDRIIPLAVRAGVTVNSMIEEGHPMARQWALEFSQLQATQFDDTNLG